MAISLPIVSSFDKRGLDNAKRALQSFAGFAADVGKIAAAAVSAVAVASVREASQFETSIAKIEGLVGIAGQELEKLTEAARRLGPETGKSAQEASDALFVIASAGLRGTDAIDALELSLKASTAGLGETQDIARAVSGALNAYGTDVINAAQATDVIVATARAGNFETSQFAAAIGRVLPFAEQAGASLEDMGGAVALLTRTNGDAAQSVTQVSALFRAFVVPTEQAKTALDKVGLSAQDMRDAIARDGLPAALDMLDEKLGGNREELGRLLGSSEAASAAFQILNADNGTLAETFGAVNDAAGITNEAFEVMAETAGFKFNQTMGEVREILISIGDGLLDRLLPYLERFASWVSENKAGIIGAFDSIFGAVDRVAQNVLGFVEELAADEEFMGALGDFKQAFIDMEGPAKDVAGALKEILLLVTPAATGAFADFGFAVSGVAQIIGGIAGILRTLTGTLPEDGDAVDDYADRWTKAIPILGAWIGEDGGLYQIGLWFTKTREKLEEESEKIELFWASLAEVFTLGGDEILLAIQGTWENVKQVFVQAFEDMFGITQTGMNVQQEELYNRGPVLQSISSGLMMKFLQGLLDIWPSIGEWFTSRGEVIKQYWENAPELLLEIGADIIEGLLNGLKSRWDAVRRWVTDKVNWIKNTFANAMKIGSPSKVFHEYGENIMQGLLNGLDSLSPEVDATVNGLVSVPSAPPGAVPGRSFMGGGINITVNAGMGTNGNQVGEQIVAAIKRYERSSGKVFASA